MRLAHATRLVVYSFAITLLHPASPFTNTVVHPISGVVNKRSKRVILHDKRTYHDCSHDRSRGHSSSTWEDGVQSHTTYDRRLSIGVISRRSVSVNLFACLGDDESLEDDELWPRPVRGNARVADDREVTDETVVNEQLACTSSDDDDLCDGEQDTNSRTLDQVVARLRGEIQAGTIPQIKSRVALDGLFAELRNRPPPKSSGTTLNVGSAAGAAGADGPRSESSNRAGRTPTPLALNGATTNRRQHQQGKKTNNTSADARKASGTVVSTSDEPGTLPGNSYSGDGEDLESLADMLSRLQANAQARDLAEADARAAVLRSGGPVGESFSTLIASKHTDMRTRFASIREGRVSWAVLPLILRAREARIPLSTGVYNAAISAYMSQPHKYSDALKVLDLLRNSDEPDVKPDVHSYNCAARVCGEAGKWRVVFQLLEQMREEGLQPNTVSYNQVLNGMAKRREWYRARRVFHDMVRGGFPPDVHSYNNLVEAAGMGSIAPRRNMIQIVYDMEQAGVEPTAYTYTLLLHCLAQRRKIFDGFQVMARLVDARAPLLPLGYRAGLLCCKEHGDWRRAMVLMENMRMAGKRPSGLMYFYAVQACADGGQWERALSLMVERRASVARDEKEAAAAGARGKSKKKKGYKGKTKPEAEKRAKSQRRAEELDMKTLEAVLRAVSAAGQFEVAIRLVHQMRSTGATPAKSCYISTMRAAAKWARWDLIEDLLQDMRSLGVGVEATDTTPPTAANVNGDMFAAGNTTGVVAQTAVDVSGDMFPARNTTSVGGLGRLTPDCYAFLIEAYAQASMWTRAIAAYYEGFVARREHAPPASYRVYECVLKACVGAGEGRTALEIIRRQAAEPYEALPGGRRKSGGPPDRRCWCLAAEALGREGLVKEGHGVLRAMVKSGIPMRESTKREVPSLLPLPTADGFVWHQRKRKRRPPPAALRASSPAFMMRRREAAIRLLLDPSTDEPIARAYRRGVNSHKKSREEEANGGEGKGVAVGRFEGVERLSLGLGWLLVSDWRFRKSEMAQNVELFGVRALERKRRRMHEFSLRRKMEENQRGDDVTMLGSTAPPCPSNGESRGTKLADERLYGVVAPRPGLDLKPGGRRGRNEAVSLWMRYQRTPGVLGRGTSRLQSRRPEAAEPYARSLGSDSSKVPARGASRREEGRTSQS